MIAYSFKSQLTVELALNLVWAALAVALLVFWSAKASSFESRRRSALALLALVCVICIMFPVISMTDDLSASPAEPENRKSLLAVHADFLLVSGPWILVYDPNETCFCHQVEVQPDYRPPLHSYLSFLLTQRPPPQLG